MVMSETLSLLGILLSSSLPVTTEGELRHAVEACSRQSGKCVIELPEGRIDLSRTLELCPPVVLRGQGSSLTTLFTPSSTTAVHMLPYSICKATGRSHSGGAKLVGMTILGKPPVEEDIRATRGVLIQHPGQLDDVRVQRFVVGVEVTADVKRTPPSNANGWRLTNVFIQGHQHAGFWSRGGDSNVGTWIGGYSGSNCQRATKWEPLLGVECAGIVERSFLGNTFVGISTASNRSKKPGCHADNSICLESIRPGYAFVGNSQRSVCLGCYAEGDQAVAQLSPQSVSIGGISSWTGTGLRISGANVSGLIIKNAQDPKNVTELRLGNTQNMGGVFMTFSPDPTTWPTLVAPLRMKWDPTTGEYKWDLANLGRFGIVRLMGVGDGAFPRGTLRLQSSIVTP